MFRAQPQVAAIRWRRQVGEMRRRCQHGMGLPCGAHCCRLTACAQSQQCLSWWATIASTSQPLFLRVFVPITACVADQQHPIIFSLHCQRSLAAALQVFHHLCLRRHFGHDALNAAFRRNPGPTHAILQVIATFALQNKHDKQSAFKQLSSLIRVEEDSYRGGASPASAWLWSACCCSTGQAGAPHYCRASSGWTCCSSFVAFSLRSR